MFEKDMAYSLVCIIEENLETILKRSKELKSPHEFASSEQGMILLDSICMKLVAIGESIKSLDKLPIRNFLSGIHKSSGNRQWE